MCIRDSYWSGNTTDICPVGALTSSDFRFGARPWELTPVAGICTHCPVGCNTTMSTRREAASGGRNVIKRIMPRQNEWVLSLIHILLSAAGRKRSIGACQRGRRIMSWKMGS